MATRIDELYEQDFYVWTQRQAAALRRLAETRPNAELDFPHLIEEVEDLGRSQRDAVRSQLRRIIEHCLKLEYSRALEPRGGWYDSIMDARAELDDKLSPSLRRDLEAQLPRLWARTRTKVDHGLRRLGEPASVDPLPVDCAYALDDLLADGWYPVNRRGLPHVR
jgi:Domain of unknown function DUF29